MATDQATRTAQRHSLLGIVSLFVSLCMVVGYALVMDGRRGDTIEQLSVALAEQRDQFSDCTSKQPKVPKSTCEEPVADEPAKIVKESEEAPKSLIDNTTAAPTTIIGPTGPAGPSAYQIAIANGFRGTAPSWLESLKGPSGLMGAPGLAGESAYEIAQGQGFTGSEAAWIASLSVQGPPGPNGPPGLAGRNGLNGDDGSTGAQGQRGEDGSNGADGRGITSVECLADGTWRITFTDGTSAPATGPCKGQTGDKGDTGDRGEKGEKGDAASDAPPIPPSEVDKALRAYCADTGECRGKTGQRGAPGITGAPEPCPESNFSPELVEVETTEGPKQAQICTAG